MGHIKSVVFGLCLLSVSSALAAPTTPKYEACLDYWKVGVNGSCKAAPEEKKKKPKQKKIAKKPKTAKPVSTTEIPIEPEEIPQKTVLNKKIDQFLEDYGKPPREFVAFHLEPTLENALKWVYKYNSMLKRNRDLTYAWTQAEKLFDDAVATGEDPKELNVDLPPDIPDFGVTLPGFPKFPTGSNLPKAPMPLSGALFGQGGPLNSNITLPVPPKVGAGLTVATQLNKRAPENFIPITQDGRVPGQMHIDYYFSAECPYCKRFEPGFDKIVKEMGDKVSVTCVDMTPSSQTQANINGKVDCDWRPIKQGEIQKMGITRTPSLIISRSAGSALERVTGYVDPDKLRTYLLK